LAFLRSYTPSTKDAGEVALRWTRAFRAEPELAADLVRIGGVASTIPARFVEGVEQPDPIDPLRLAYEAGRRDLALKLLAAGNIGQYQLNQLLEPHDD
jgi:hypothetical protein